MYGLIGRILCAPGQRDALGEILGGMGAMPGCVSYVVAEDSADPDALWVTEVWETSEHHAQSLQLPEVQAAIGAGRELIAAMDRRFETRPIGGIGLS